MSTFNKLSDDILTLLIAVQEKPLATIDELSNRTGISKPTVAKRMKLLEGVQPSETAQHHPEGRYFTTAPIIDNQAIGLEFFGVMIETANIDNMRSMEKIADKHPYTQYSVRCFGKYNGLYMQFRTPIGTVDLIRELLNIMQERNTISEYSILPRDNSRSVYSNLSVKGWDSAKMTWDFNMDKWFKFKTKKNPREQEERKPCMALEWLTKKDVHIINEVMGGARRKNLDIIKSLNEKGIEITPQTFSRRYKMIQKDCFNGFRTNFDPTIFDVYTSVIVSAEGSKQYLSDLRTQLITNPFPFFSTLRIVENHMFWFLRLQSAHLSNLLSNLYSNLNHVSVFLADYSSSKVFNVWPEAFSDERNGWITDYDFMVTKVLDK
ncbi:MAG: winged helix-turn-helix transcriptional regulator [Candidatus Thorarchaeota archaeon]